MKVRSQVPILADDGQCMHSIVECSSMGWLCWRPVVNFQLVHHFCVGIASYSKFINFLCSFSMKVDLDTEFSYAVTCCFSLLLITAILQVSDNYCGDRWNEQIKHIQRVIILSFVSFLYYFGN